MIPEKAIDAAAKAMMADMFAPHEMPLSDELAARYRETARAALTAALPHLTVQEGWQPIETAPTDGTKFWGDEGQDAIAMFWHPQFGEFVSSFRRMTMAPGYLIDGQPHQDHSPVVHKPKQWMPMPVALVAEQREAD